MEVSASHGRDLRHRYLRWQHGFANVAFLLAMHVGLAGWLLAGEFLVPFGVYLLLSILVCVIHQRLLSEWFHEATHWNLFPNRRWNDWLQQVLIGPFNGTRVQTHRLGHFRHHAATEYFVSGDPDTAMSAANTRSELAWGVVRDLSGVNALATFLKKNQDDSESGPSFGSREFWWILTLLLVHGTLFAATLLTGHYAVYPLYFGSLLTLYPLVNRIRIYGQHAAFRSDGSIYLNGSSASRSFHAGLFEQLVLNSPMIMYHCEHHAHPNLPYRALRHISQPSEDPNSYGSSCFRVAGRVMRDLR
jgi:fatty acid desaturase